MLNKFAKRIRLNFRKTRGDRVATLSYSNYHQHVRKMLTNNLAGLKNRVNEYIKKKK